MSASSLGEPRHTCLGCGGSCHGVVVRLVSAAEAVRVTRSAASLGVADPIVDGALRRVDGRCVFLDEAERCRIHATEGAAAKPTVCQQYPAVLVRTGEGTRLGIDPGCYTAWRTVTAGDPVPSEVLAASDAELGPDQAAIEATLLRLTEGATVSSLLARLATPGVEGRWLRRLHDVDLGRLLARPDTGRHVRDAVSPMVRRAAELTEPGDPLPPLLDAWAVEVLRRTLFLRIARRIPAVQGAALLTLLGAVSAGWATHDPDAFGRALAGWSRALRAPPFWGALLPDPGALRSLATGV